MQKTIKHDLNSILVILVFTLFFHHSRPQIKVPFTPTENDIFDVENPFFLKNETSVKCYIIGECSKCPDLLTTSPCNKDPRYRLNIHCTYDKIPENISDIPILPSWVACIPSATHETAFLVVTSALSIFDCKKTKT
ncbi:unnamed protein product [Pneumocystis jirovecii]|uniref:Uncharacterized protein n=1 Tax=Pneumocystis jirovecii TaxID=42068 RepID=L0PDQ2_PNEJI|nr:unnamed protein product [Pneumocystis jirovecii]